VSVDPLIHHLLRVGGALLFAAAAAHKLRGRASFQSALAGYRLLPASWARPAARTMPWLELGLASALLYSASAAWAGAALLATYAAAIAINLLRGRAGIDCGCGGPGGSRPLGLSLVVRNLVLAALLLLSTAPVVARGWTALDSFHLAVATLAAALLYTAIDVALANASRQRLLWGGA
jgi:hypothetical protein